MSSQKEIPPNFRLSLAAQFLFLLLVPVSFLFSSGCAREPVSRRQGNILGVSSEIVIVGKNKSAQERILAEAFQILRDLDAKMNPFEEASEVQRINEKGFETPQPVSRETFEALQVSLEFFEKSRGAFDVTTLPLLKLWGFLDGNLEVPQREEIVEILPRVGSDQIILDAPRQSVGFQAAGMGIDLSGIAQGYACDRAVLFLKSQGVEHALVSVGETIRVFGKGPDGGPWRVGLRHPRDLTRTLRVVTLEDEAVATTGDYEKFFVVNGHRYSHIFDPTTGYPANESVVVTVMAPSAVQAHALSVSLFVLGPERAPLMARQFRKARWYLTHFTNGDHFKTLSSEPTS